MSGDRRIPSLDGLRAISIVFVLIGHAVGTQGFEVDREHMRWFALGNLGVRVFFVISGYLITTLLINEHEKYGKISIKQFYFRRTFRIFPAFYVFIAAMVLADLLSWIALNPSDALHAVTYTMNYQPDRAWQVGHVWSLAVEEQFYLLWPALLVIFGLRRGVWIAALYVLAAPVVRVVTYRYLPDQRDGIGESFQTIADAIAVGCVFAFMHARISASRYARFRSSALFLLVPATVLFANYFRDRISISYPLGETVMNVGIVLTIDWCIQHPDGVVGRVLNWRPLVWIGLLSYSLYLWQQPFLDRHSDAWVTAFPINLIFAFAAAAASYYLIEQPSLRWRARIGKRLFAKAPTKISE